jgi:hypothetical protein
MDESAPDTKGKLNAEMRELLRCKRCNLPYASARSTSALRLTYCSLFCELSDLGFSMDALEHMQKKEEHGTEETPREPVAID